LHDLRTLGKGTIEAIRIPFHRFASIQTDRKTHVTVFFLYSKSMKPLFHVGIVVIVKDHETNIHINAIDVDCISVTAELIF